ncbi:MAG: hypothetical protein ACK412_11120, partial [Chloroherpetonaceae bacterium]
AVVVVKALTSAIPPCVQDVEAIHISTEREKLIPLFAFIAAIIFFFLVFIFFSQILSVFLVKIKPTPRAHKSILASQSANRRLPLAISQG